MNNEKQGLFRKAWALQEKIEARGQRFGKGKYGRVFKMARKPSPEHYEKTAMIVGLGILAIGGLGFTIYMIKQLVIPFIMKALGY